MAGLDPAIHLARRRKETVDARLKAGHDERVESSTAATSSNVMLGRPKGRAEHPRLAYVRISLAKLVEYPFNFCA
jgi:hypothetical protein